MRNCGSADDGEGGLDYRQIKLGGGYNVLHIQTDDATDDFGHRLRESRAACKSRSPRRRSSWERAVASPPIGPVIMRFTTHSTQS